MTTYVQESNIRRRLSDDLARDPAFVFDQVLDLSPACRSCKSFDAFVDDAARGECMKRAAGSSGEAPMSDFKWTAAADALLTEMWGKHSSRAIAERVSKDFDMSLTRSAVGGRAKRLKLPRQRTGVDAHETKPKPKRQLPVQRKSGGFLALVGGHPLDAQPVPLDTALPASAIGLLALTNETCRFPFEPEPQKYVFCGLAADLAGGKPYCSGHAAIAFWPKR